MAKYHIGRDGLPHQCRAKKGNCPYASDDEHFTDKVEALQAAQERLENESGDMGFSQEVTQEQPTPRRLSKQEITKYANAIEVAREQPMNCHTMYT